MCNRMLHITPISEHHSPVMAAVMEQRNEGMFDEGVREFNDMDQY